MRHPVTRNAVLSLFAVLMAVGMVYAVYAAEKPAKLPTMTISITKTGIACMPKSAKGGDYTVTIKNSTSAPRGIEMTGMDRGDSPYVRYTKILKPGAHETFRWYFPSGRTAYLKDLLSCKHESRSCVIATFGTMVKAIHFK